MSAAGFVRRITTALYALKGAGRTGSARYCYSVWLAHLVTAGKTGLSVQPETVAELGPGESLGVGLAALLCGADKYYALDVIEYAHRPRDVEILDELVRLFRRREPISHENEFPHHILTEERLKATLCEERVAKVRRALMDAGSGMAGPIEVCYVVPWHDSACIEEQAVDMILSTAVLEHVEDLPYTYQQLSRWLKPSGFMSHQIDFCCHGMALSWNGHWAHSDRVWKLVAGVWPYLLNREPYSTHARLLQEAGLETVCELKVRRLSGVGRHQLAPRFRDMSDDDLTTRGALVQAVKRP